MAREDADTRYAKGLYKEYLQLKKNAEREGAHPAERDYYYKMASATYNKIDQKALNAKKKKVEKKQEEFDEYDR